PKGPNRMRLPETLWPGLLLARSETAGDPIQPFLPDTFWPGLIMAALYGLLGIVLVVGGFKVLDVLTPRVDFQQELAEKQNVAVAIVIAAFILGICFVVAYAIV